MINYNKLIGQHLKHLREFRRMTTRDLEKRSGISCGTISNYENGKHSIDIDKLHTLCNALDYDMIQFLKEIYEES